MWKWILQILSIAAEINMRRSTIFLVIELLRQFNRSLVSSENQPQHRQTGHAGFVYVSRESANGERFKIGRRAKPPWRDSQLRSELGERADFVLIIPAKDAKALEKSLRQAYAKHGKKSEWFSLPDRERREVLIIAALVQLAAGDDLGMAAVAPEIVQLAKNLLTHLKAVARVMWNKREAAHHQPSEEDGASDPTPDLDDFSAIPDFDWNWESVLSKHYRALPKLKGKEAYLSVIRDNNARQGRISFDNHPVESIETAFVDRSLRFPLEIVLILKVDNKKKAKRALLSPSRDRDGNDWVALSDEALGEIKEFATAEWQGDSIYVGPKTHFGLETLSSDDFREYPKLEETAGYVCVVQGVKCGKSRKIWSSRHPKRWTRYSWRARELNSPHDLRASSDPFRFKCLIRAAHSQSFKKYLHNRYRQQRRKRGWFELDDAQLEEICRMGR